MRYLAIFLAIFIISCSAGNSSDQTEPVSNEKKSTTNKSSCLSEMTDPGSWYSSSQVSAISNTAEADIEKSVNERFKQVQFNWKNDRKYTMKIGNSEMEVPTNNVIAITIKNLDEEIEKANSRYKREYTFGEYFNSFYGQVTKEDEKIINEVIDKKGEEDENFDAKTAKKMLSMAPTEGYSDISDIGDDANIYVQLAPGLRETRMAILHGNVVIQLNVDISDEDDNDFEAAKKIAREVIALCD